MVHPVHGSASGREPARHGGVAPALAYIEELPADLLEGRIQPGTVSDRTGGLDEVPDGYRAMNDRAPPKVLVTP